MCDLIEPDTPTLNYVHQCFLQTSWQVSDVRCAYRGDSFQVRSIDSAWKLGVSLMGTQISFKFESGYGKPLATCQICNFRHALPVILRFLDSLNWGRFANCAHILCTMSAAFPGVLFNMYPLEIASLIEPDSEALWADRLDMLRSALEHDLRFCLDNAGLQSAHMYSDPSPFAHVWVSEDFGSIDAVGFVDPYRVRVTVTGRYGTQLFCRTACAPTEYRRNIVCAFDVVHKPISW